MQIDNKNFDEERALYGQTGLTVKNCSFAGVADGESALKECREISVSDCFFDLRYPFWHVNKFAVSGSEMTKNCRAAIWYSQNGEIKNSKLHGIKALRECKAILLDGCEINSPEFGWKCEDVNVKNCSLNSEYPFFECSNICCDKLEMTGKYSFQYLQNGDISDSVLATKDAFWHSKNVTIKNSKITGEYLGWYSENLTLIDCTIEGTQPFCYCKGLKLVNCTMNNTDLAFERSEVEATVQGEILSVKNPLCGYIKCEKIGEFIWDLQGRNCNCEITTKEK